MGGTKTSAEFPPDGRRQWEVFHRARETDHSERTAYLESVKKKDPELYRQVQELLAAEEGGGSMFENLISQELNLLEEPVLQEIATPQPGEILADRFRIVEPLGIGGMGSVYKAEDQELGTTVALKLMHSDLALDDSARERFHREINVARQITHPNVCRIFDLFRHEDYFFLTMELLPGETLHERIRREGRMQPQEALPIALHVLEALDAIHRSGIIHRDLKTTNIILVPDGNGFRAVITDFGLAIPLLGEQSFQVTGTGQVLGTPEFMAPEQLTKGPISPATDVYALGMVFHEMITGKLPMEGEAPLTIAARRIEEDPISPRRFVPELDRNWDRTILRCLERNPRHRFQNAAEVESALTGKSVFVRMSMFSSRYRAHVLLGLLISVIGLLLFLYFWKGENLIEPGASPEMLRKRLWTGATGLPAGVLSTDGKILTDVDWQSGDVMAIDLATGRKRRLTDSGVWFVPRQFTSFPETTLLSPDGKMVAYSSIRGLRWGCDLRIVSIERSTPQVLYSDLNTCSIPVDWTSDGTKILALFQRKDHTVEVGLVSAADGSVRFVQSLSSIDVRKMCLSPDGRYVVYDSQQGESTAHNLFLLSVKDGTIHQLTNHVANEYPLAWTPDGKRVVFASDRSGTNDAWVLAVVEGKPKGPPERMRKDIGQIFPLKLTSDGSLFYSHLLSSMDIYMASLGLQNENAESSPLRLAHGVVGSNTAPEFTPDGKFLLYQTVENPLVTSWSYPTTVPTVMKMLTLESGQEQNFSHQLKYIAGRIRCSRDGRSILTMGDDGISGPGLYRIKFESGDSSLVVRSSEDNQIWSYDWSADGSSVYYMLQRGGGVFSHNISAGTSEIIHSGAVDFGISPDGNWLAITGVDVHQGITSLKILSVTGGETREILKINMPEWISTFTWTPESRSIVFAKGRRDLIDQPHSLWEVSINGSPVEDLGILTDYAVDIRVHPDGKRAAVWTVVDTSEVWVMENFLTLD